MHEFVSFNRQIIRAETSFLSATSSAALYGKGVFTTVAFYRFEPFVWEKHFLRLSANAAKIGIDLPEVSEKTLKSALLELACRNNLENGRARLTVFDESPSRIWQNEAKIKTSFLIQTADFRPFSKDRRLMVSPFRVNSTSPLVNVKSCNYLENILALEDAKAKGFDEAVRLNERGEIVSAATANIFWIKNETLFTASTKTGCLPGTTRAFILENFAVEQVKAPLFALAEADAIFLTSAGIGIVKIKSFDGKIFTQTSKAFDELYALFPKG